MSRSSEDGKPLLAERSRGREAIVDIEKGESAYSQPSRSHHSYGASQEIPASSTVKLITAVVTFCIILGVAIPILLVCIIGGILRLHKDFDFALQLVHFSRGLWITSLPIPILIYIAIFIFQPIKVSAPTERTKGMLAVAAVYVLAQVGIWFMLSTEELSLMTKIEAALALPTGAGANFGIGSEGL